MIPKGEHVNGDEIPMESAGDRSCLKLIEFELQVRIFIFLELVWFKGGCVFPVAIVSMLPHAEFGPNDHREDAPHFSFYRTDFGKARQQK